MWTSLQLLASLCLSVHAASLIQPEWGYYFEQDDQGPGTYTYGYDIEDPATRNIQFRRERRLLNGTVTGSYGLVEPDGNVKIVHYTADHLGYRTTIENSQRENENHPPLPVVMTWAAHRPAWDSLWFRSRPHWDPLWHRQQSPALSHALSSLQTLHSPVHEERTPPALRGEYYQGDYFQANQEYAREGSDQLRHYQDYNVQNDVPVEDKYQVDSAPDQSQNYPVYDLPPDNQEGRSSAI